jgi:hypothetical protein
MKTTAIATLSVLLLVVCLGANAGHAKGDDFGSVVKMIEQFYNVKHQGIPWYARAGMKVVGTGAKIKGGTAKRFAELGSVKLALFEDQEFEGDFAKFRSSLNAALKQTWMPLVQTFSANDDEQEQTYIFLRENGNKFTVLVITLEQHEGTVIQATLSSDNLAQLLKDPENAGKTLSREATINDQE